MFFFSFLVFLSVLEAQVSDFDSALQLARSADYEFALPQLIGMESESFLTENPSQAAEYWFYRAVCEHQMFQKAECLKSLDQLDSLVQKPNFVLPVRFTVLSRLMRKDLETLQDESLEMISRHMRGVERQLGAGNGNERVQKSEEEIVKMLDSMINELEEKENQQKKSLVKRNAKPSAPMKKAQIGGGKGPGNVTRKDLDFHRAWGNLPEKEREEVLQQLGRDFPPHYRDAIEQYFKRMAE